MANKFKSCILETHYECVSCFKHLHNRLEYSLNVSEDEAGYQEDSPKWVSRSCGCQNVSRESSKQYQEKIAVKKKQTSISSFFTKSK